MVDARVHDYWQRFLSTREDGADFQSRGYVADSFGDSPEMATELASLIVAGFKTATCSSVWEWDDTTNPMPREGLLTVVIDGAGTPRCIIETVRIETATFDVIGSEFAYAEGEGDRSLEYWRRVHWDYFSRALPKLGHEPSLTMPVVCEHFRVLYR